MVLHRPHRCAPRSTTRDPRAYKLLLALLCGASHACTRAIPTAPHPTPVARAAASTGAPSRRATPPAPSPTNSSHDAAAQLRAAIQRSAHYLVRATKDDGRFRYLINLNPTAAVPRDYNVLRHAGAVYALTQVQARWPNSATLAAITRATRYLLQHYSATLPQRPAALAIWSQPIVMGRREAKLGGAGLALLALVRLSPLAPTLSRRIDRTGLATFIDYMQKPDGTFYSKFYTDARGRSAAWTSLYYPGEAAFGMSELYALDGPPSTAAPPPQASDATQQLNDSAIDGERTARKALLALAAQRRDKAEVQADHWALLATASILRQQRASAAERTRLIEHCTQICRHILTRADANLPAASPFHGSLPPVGHITPTATRLEGLLAALRVLPAHHRLRPAMLLAIHDGVVFLQRAQVKHGRYRGAMPRQLPSSDDPRSTEVRIDYVQHTLSAWIGYWDWLQQAGRGGSR